MHPTLSQVTGFVCRLYLYLKTFWERIAELDTILSSHMMPKMQRLRKIRIVASLGLVSKPAFSELKARFEEEKEKSHSGFQLPILDARRVGVYVNITIPCLPLLWC